MARYKVIAKRRGKSWESEIIGEASAHNLACELVGERGVSVVTVVEDQEGADHPANAGKFFLHRIYK
jgi:hypothetical protein